MLLLTNFIYSAVVRSKMKIDSELIEHVASVARLNLTEEEVKEFLPQLKEVLKAFSKLSEVDTEGIQPSFQPIVLKNHLRDDEKGSCLSQDDALSNTEHKKDGYFKGPRAV